MAWLTVTTGLTASCGAPQRHALRTTATIVQNLRLFYDSGDRIFEVIDACYLIGNLSLIVRTVEEQHLAERSKQPRIRQLILNEISHFQPLCYIVFLGFPRENYGVERNPMTLQPI